MRRCTRCRSTSPTRPRSPPVSPESRRSVGPLDICVNNAGMQRRAPFTEFTIDDWNALMATNVTSAFLVGREVAIRMKQRGRGKIINIASLQSEVSRPGIAPYAATKGAIKMLTRGMCADSGRFRNLRQRNRSRLLRDRTHQRPGRRRRVLRLGPRPHTRGALGQGGRSGRHTDLPRLRCLRIRQRPDRLRRRRHALRAVTRVSGTTELGKAHS